MIIIYQNCSLSKCCYFEKPWWPLIPQFWTETGNLWVLKIKHAKSYACFLCMFMVPYLSYRPTKKNNCSDQDLTQVEPLKIVLSHLIIMVDRFRYIIIQNRWGRIEVPRTSPINRNSSVIPCYISIFQYVPWFKSILVGGWAYPSENMKVNGKDDIPYIGKI